MLVVWKTRPLWRQLAKSRLVYRWIESDSHSPSTRRFWPVPYQLRLGNGGGRVLSGQRQESGLGGAVLLPSRPRSRRRLHSQEKAVVLCHQVAFVCMDLWHGGGEIYRVRPSLARSRRCTVASGGCMHPAEPAAAVCDGPSCTQRTGAPSVSKGKAVLLKTASSMPGGSPRSVAARAALAAAAASAQFAARIAARRSPAHPTPQANSGVFNSNNTRSTGAIALVRGGV
jgi:hypothetical protein